METKEGLMKGLMGQDEHAKYALTILDNANEQAKFIDVVSSGRQAGEDAMVHFQSGVDKAKASVAAMDQQMDSALRFHEMELEKVTRFHQAEISKIRRSQELLGSIKMVVPQGEQLYSSMIAFKQGHRPGAIDQAYLERRLRYMNYHVAALPASNLAEAMFCHSWEAIDMLTYEEKHEILTFMSIERYTRNSDFGANLEHYAKLGVIGNDFPRDSICGNLKNTNDTLAGLIALYLRKVPLEAHQYVFTRQLKTTGGDPPCWVPKSGATGVADGPLNTPLPP